MSLFGGGRREPRERTEEERRQALIERERRRAGDPGWQPPAGHPLAPASSAPTAQPAVNGSEPVLRPARPAAAPQSATPPPAAPQPPAAAAAPQRQPAAPQRQPAAPQQPAARPATQAAAQPAARVAQPQSPPQAQPQHPADAGEAGTWWDDGDLFTEEPQRPVAAWPPPGSEVPPAPVHDEVPPAPVYAEQPVLRPRAPRQPVEPVQINPEPPAQPVAPAYDLPDHRQVAVHRRRSFASRSTTRTVVSPPGDANMGGTLAPPSRKRRVALLFLLLVFGLIAWSQWVLWQPTKGGGTSQVVVKIPQGAGASEVGQRLADAGVIDSPRVFTLRAIIAGQRDDLPSGNVTLKQGMSYGAALASLSGGNVGVPDLVPVTIPEGLSIREMAARFKRQNTVDDYGATAVKILRERRAELRADYGVPKTARSLEGLLFPSTFELPAGFTARDLIERQLQAFDQTLAGVSMTKAKKANLTPYDVITIASMIEREARITRERSLISAVIYNRLKAGMPLGIDATFRYASGDWQNPITQSQLSKDGPYNSRLRTGLPPTPIGNPGLASIEAAANPAKVNYLYFVVKPGRCGEHAFAATAAKFEQDSAKYNAARDAAGGSPVAC